MSAVPADTPRNSALLWSATLYQMKAQASFECGSYPKMFVKQSVATEGAQPVVAVSNDPETPLGYSDDSQLTLKLVASQENRPKHAPSSVDCC